MKIWVSFQFTILLFGFAFAGSTFAEELNPGPRTAAEPNILYEDGMRALQQKNFKGAIPPFQRYLDRYPLGPQFDEIHLHLGDAYLQSGSPKLAIPAYLDYIQNHFKQETGGEARIGAIQAYIQIRHLSEARGMVEELLKQNPTLLQKEKALLLKAQILIEQKRLTEAQASLDSYEQAVATSEKPSQVPELEGSLYFKLKTAQCDQWPLPQKSKATHENVWLEFLDQIKTCFKETLVNHLSRISGQDIQEWCAIYKAKEKQIQKGSHDRSFYPKIKITFDEIRGEINRVKTLTSQNPALSEFGKCNE